MSSAVASVFENSFYVSIYLSALLAGANYALYFMTVKALLGRQDANWKARRSDQFFLAYITLLMILLTIGNATDAYFGERMWIIDRDVSGGPPAWYMENVNIWYETMGTAASMLQVIASDSLLLYRCFILWDSSYAIIAMPSLILLGSIVVSIFTLIAAGSPDGNFFAGVAVEFGTSYYALTVGFNVIVTLLICTRLLLVSRGVSALLGPDSCKVYTSLSTIFLESAALYSLAGIMFIIPYARDSQTAIIFGDIYAAMSCLMPMLIVYRIVTKRAWDRETVSMAVSSAAFAPGTGTSRGLTQEMQSEDASVHHVAPTTVHLKHERSDEEVLNEGSSMNSESRMAFRSPSPVGNEKGVGVV